ncbi:MAG: bacteriocin-protection protein [Bacteroidetes bacterium]|nr:bacteriocin-protection protein [Bacteroidota bacterium]
METATFFTTPELFRNWLDAHHDKSNELWVGYYKIATKIPSITWPESVDEALCYGWIDGLRRRIDEKSYMIRFTPRRKNSHWSKVNLAKIKMLITEGRLKPAGKAIYEKRNVAKIARSAHEQKDIRLKTEFEKQFQINQKAWDYFSNRTASYRKQCTWWIMSAKKESTSIKRLNILIDCSEKELAIPQLRRS